MRHLLIATGGGDFAGELGKPGDGKPCVRLEYREGDVRVLFDEGFWTSHGGSDGSMSGSPASRWRRRSRRRRALASQRGGGSWLTKNAKGVLLTLLT